MAIKTKEDRAEAQRWLEYVQRLEEQINQLQMEIRALRQDDGAVIAKLQGENNRLGAICTDTIKYLEEAEAEVEQLKLGLIRATAENAQLRAKISTIEAAALAAYRYHMLGYKDAESFNANIMLDHMNKLGEVL